MTTKRIIIIAALLLIFVRVAQAEGWSTVDKSLLGIYTAANVVDILQTRYIHGNDRYEEKNFLLKGAGKNGSTLIMLGVNVGLFFAADAIPKYRTTILTVSSIIKIGVTAHNYSIGVGVKF